jgi:hypothetical protein
VTTTPDFPTITSRLSLSRVLDVTEGAIRRAEAEGRIRRTRAGEWDVLDVVRAWRANTRRHVGTPLPAWLDSDVDLDEDVLRQLAFRARQEARRSQRKAQSRVGFARARGADEQVAGFPPLPHTRPVRPVRCISSRDARPRAAASAGVIPTHPLVAVLRSDERGNLAISSADTHRGEVEFDAGGSIRRVDVPPA